MSVLERKRKDGNPLLATERERERETVFPKECAALKRAYLS